MVVQNKLGIEDASRCAEALENALAVLNLPIDLAFAKSEVSNLSYLHDFVAMNVEHSAVLNRWDQVRLLL